MAPINLWACSAVCPFEGKEESLISGRAPSPAGAGAGSALPAEAAQVCQARFQLRAAAKLLCPFLHVPGCARLLMGSSQPELRGNSRLATVAGSLCCAGFASIPLLGDQNPPKSCCSPPQLGFPVWINPVLVRFQGSSLAGSCPGSWEGAG